MATKKYDDPILIAKVKALQSKGFTSHYISKDLGISQHTVVKIFNSDSEGDKATEEIEKTEDVTNESIGLFILSPRIKTVEQALEKAEIDPETWEVTKCTIKSYELGCKVEGTNAHGHKFTRGIAVEPLYGITLHCKKKKGYSSEEFLARLGEVISEKRPKNSYTPPSNISSDYVGVLSIPDIHFGKYAWSGSSKDTYNLDIAVQRYEEANGYLLRELSIYTPTRILYIVGNDLLHVDTSRSTTTKGTYVESDSAWQDAYIQAADTIARSINECKHYAPVDVLVIAGNHDEDKCFTLGHALHWYFKDDKYVTVDWSPHSRKYRTIGKTLIGFEHGHRMDRDKKSASLVMASECADTWGQCKYHEILTGHWHHKKDSLIESYQVESFKDTIIRYLPSLAGTDRWHYENGYVNVKAAEAHVYNVDTGHCATLEYRIPE